MIFNMETKKRKYIKRIIRIFLLLMAAFILGAGGLFVFVKKGHYGYIPSQAQLGKIQNSQASEIYSRDSVLLGRYYLENRVNIDFQSLPPFLIQALLATEDVRFYEHSGIDVMSLFRVLFRTVLAGDKEAGGGSTITQQLAKNLFPRKRTQSLHIVGAKLREMIIARRMEKVYAKEEILQLYLNTVPFGRNTFGIKAASKLYFNKLPSHLAPGEAATLIGMLKGNALYDPIDNNERAENRRNTVLQQMQVYGYLQANSCDSLQSIPLVTDYTPLDHNHGLAPYFREMLRPHLEAWCSEHTNSDGAPYNLYTDGLKIYTTLDAKLQQTAEKAFDKQLKSVQRSFLREWEIRNTHSLEKRIIKQRLAQLNLTNAPDSVLLQKRKMQVYTPDGLEEKNYSIVDSIAHYIPMLHGGFLALSPHTGEVLSWIGGIDARFFKYDHVLSKRQAGSVFKPVVYLQALEQGMEPCDLIENDSLTYDIYENWTPENADAGYGGYYSLKGALVHSVNTVAVKLLMETGIDTVIHTAHQLGIHSDLEAVPSLALGVSNLSLHELVSSYGTFANRGNNISPYSLMAIADAEGHIIEKFSSRKQKITDISETSFEQLTFMLQKAVEEGTGRSIHSYFNVRADVAGKTGTTQNQADGWFVGYTPDLVFGAWVGAEYPSVHFLHLTQGQGAATALPIVGEVLRQTQQVPSIKHYLQGTFRYRIDTSRYNCPDFREEAPGIIERIFGKPLLKRKQEESSQDKKQKKGFFKRLFGRKEKNDSIQNE
jgi:penicillin-binding protein 1A